MPEFKIPLTELYIGYFGRAPEPDGLTFWEDALEGGFTLLAAAQDFAGQAETLEEYPYLADPTTNDLEAFLTTVYANLFNREPDAVGLTFWVDAIEDGLPLGTAILSIIQGATGDDIATLQNKVDLACAWHDLAANEPDFELTPAAITSSREALALVTSNPESVAEAAAATGANETFFNDAPVLEVTPVLTELPEDADTSARIKVADIAVTDDDLGTNVLSLSGTDAALFEIEGDELFLSAGAALDFETLAALDVTVEVDDAALEGAPEDSVDLPLAITDVNEAPSLTLTPVVTTLGDDADRTAAIKVADIVVSDDALGTNDLTLAGDDAALFDIVGTELFLRAGATLDGLGNASLDVEVLVDDAGVGATPDGSAALAISVTESNTVPFLSLTPVLTTLAEDADTAARIKVADLAITDDGNGTNTLTLTGADAALFELDGLELFLKAGTPLDFETGAGFDVTVELDDAAVGSSPDASQAFTLSITDVNETPKVSLTPVISTLGEDTYTTVRIKVADIALTDDGLGTNVLSLSGADAALFEIDGAELFLKAGVALDFESNASLDVSVDVDDAGVGATPDGSNSFSLSLTDVDEAPEIAVTQVLSELSEDADTSARIKVADVVVSDDAQGAAVLSISGADAALFEIDGSEVFLKAGTVLDFETTPSFDISIEVDDPSLGGSPDAAVALSLTIADSNEAPSLSVTPVLSDLSEDTDTAARIKVADIAITDDGVGNNDLSLTGSDAALFEIVGAELFLKAGASLDFEAQPTLDVSVVLDDVTVGGTPDATVPLSFGVTDANEAPGVALTPVVTELGEYADTSAAIKVADITITDDALGSNDLSLSGADAALFEIVGTELFLKAGTALDFETSTNLDVTVEVDDAGVGSSPDDTAVFSLAVTDVNEAPDVSLTPVVSELAEDADTAAALKVADITVSDDALGTNDLTLSGADAALFEIIGTELFLKAGAALDFEGNPNLDVTVEVDDAETSDTPDGSDALSIAITDVNEPLAALDDILSTSEFRVNSFLGFDQADPAITTLANGNVVILWRSDVPEQGDTDASGIKGRIFDAMGGEVTSEFLVNSGTSGDQALPAVTALAGGGFVAAWEGPEGADTGIEARIFAADGTASGGDIDLNSNTAGDQNMPDLTPLPGGGFVAVWGSDAPGQGDSDGAGIKARVFDAAGAEVEAEALVNSLTTGDQTAPAIAALTGGSLAVVWTAEAPSDGDTSGTAIKARLIAEDGSEVVAEFLVNARTNGLQGAPEVTALAGGGFAVTWESYDGQDGDSSSLAVKGRIFDATGTATSNELLINSATIGFQREVDVTALEGGGFVATWASQDRGQGDSSVTAISARVFNADGSERAAEFRVNEATPRGQETPVVTALADGGFVIAWASDDRTDGDISGSAIKARRFDADGAPQTAPRAVPEDTPTTFTVAELLANDGDPDGDPIMLIELAGSDTGGTTASGATVMLNPDGTITYDPSGVAAFDALTPGQTATDNFTYTIEGADGETTQATVTLIIEGSNDLPEVSLSGTTTDLLNTVDTTSRVKVADIIVTDDGAGVNALSLTGDDAALFEIDGTELFLRAGTGLDANTNPSLDVTIEVEDAAIGTDPDDSDDLSIAVTNANDPATVTLTPIVTTFAEDQNTAVRIKVADITIADDGLGTNTVGLSGADAALFEIDGTELFLIAGAALDFETNPSLNVNVTVEDPEIAGAPDDTAAMQITVTDVNDLAPSFTSGATANAAENQTAAYTSAVTDPDGGALTFSLTGGADQALFGIHATSGVVTFNAAPDFETPGDAGGDNVYDIIVTASDSVQSTNQNVAITVTDVNEAPTVALSGTVTSLSEGADVTSRTKVADITVTDDALGTETLTLTGADAALFEIDGFELFLIANAALDFETNATLDVTVNVDDSTVGSTPDDTAALAITLTDANEAPTVALSNTVTSLSEGADVTSRTKVADITVTDDALGTETLTLTGADAALFEIDGFELYLKANAALDFETNGTLDVTVNVDDSTVGVTPDDTAALAITLTDANDAPSVALNNTVTSLSEGANVTSRTKVADITVTDDALGTETLTLTGADASLFEIDGTELFLRANAALDFETNGTLDVMVNVDDSTVGATPDDTAALAITLTDANEAPSVGLSNTVTSLSEGANVTSRTKVADITVTDDALGTETLTLTGDDAGLFEIDGFELFLIANAALDFETNGMLDVTVNVDDSTITGSPDDTAALAITLTDANDAPSVALNNTVTSLSEGANVTSRTKVADITVTDDALGTETLTLTGADASLFEIDGTELFLIANASLDFETNGTLDVTVNVDDSTVGVTPDDTAALAITLTDVNEAPTVALSNTLTTLSEGADVTSRTKVADITVTDDALGTETLTLTGDDSGLFEIFDDDLYLRANAVLDFDTNATLDVTVNVDDTAIPGSPDDTAALAITVEEDFVKIELSALELNSDDSGFVINGVSANDYSGYSVSSAGDVNGDGLDDLIVGAYRDDPNGNFNAGASFVVFGKTDGTAVELSTVEAGTGGFVINGVSADDRSGRSVSSAGDVNGDGFDDLIVGAFFDDPNGNSDSGASFVVFGKSDGTAVELSGVEAGTGGFVINGVSTSDFSGRSVSSAGDVNGDGFDDLIVGADGDDPDGNLSSGASFVVFGKSDGTAVELSAVEAGSGGFVINGVSAGDRSGGSVSSAGDVNGDGFDDLIVGAFADSPNGNISGASFVVFGKTDGTAVELSAVEAGSGGFVINGGSADDRSGRSVSAAGDINGDGLDDLIVGAFNDDPNSNIDSGASFVVFGKTDGLVVELTSIESNAVAGGFAINGVSAVDRSGYSVSAAGDVNGDGLDDLIVGAPLDDPNGNSVSGASFVVFGKTEGAAVELSAVEAGTGGFVINGVSTNDQSGRSVSNAGDVNGDGFDDLIVGAWRDSPNGHRSGASFVVFGGDFTGSATEVGTTGDDTLTGSAAVDRLIGGIGNDTLIGNGGADVLRGGQGDDVLAVSDLSFADIDGGNGLDTLRLDGSGLTLNLLALDNTSLDGIERIDLSGNGNRLVLNRIELQRLADHSNTLRVFGNATDQLEIDGAGWGFTGTVTDSEGAFDILTNGQARLELEQDVARVGGPIAPVELSALEMNSDMRGFVINGVSAGDESGNSVSAAGDVNGDGFDDLIVGAPSVDANGISNAGRSYVVFGKSDGSIAELSAVENGSNGFILNGVSEFDNSGESVSLAGDVNGDGLADLIIGASSNSPNANNHAGASFVIFGKADIGAVELSSIQNGMGGFVINGVSPFDVSGFAVSGAGDVNGDGLDDLIVGARLDDPNSNANSGASFVIFGKTGGSTVELSALEDSGNETGFAINGVSANDKSGTSVSRAGDVNGDGFDDLIVGAPADDPNGNGNSGAAFVVFGKMNGMAVELSALERNGDEAGFAINGLSADDYAGNSVSGAGDVNGDGLDDVIVGVPLRDLNGNASGTSFVVFGRTNANAVELSDVQSGVGGFAINGVTSFDLSGNSVSDAGDVNGDGFDDLIVGAYQNNLGSTFAGASFVIFGKSDGMSVELSYVEHGIGGFVIAGASQGDFSGNEVSSAGDVNGDGFSDLLIGASQADPNGDASGASFVVFGGDFGSAATEIGGVGDDTLTGSAAVDRLIGGTGNDTLIGNGGADVLRGGQGNDVLAITDLGFSDISGGNGLDMLRLDGSGLTLDLLALDNTSLDGIERIDLSGNGNTLVLDRIELQRLSDNSNTLRVLGDATDGVTLEGAIWTTRGTVTDAEGTFNAFTNGNARIEVAQAVDITRGPLPMVELSDVEGGAGGFAINGESADDRSGISVSGGGDVNGDGFDDLLVGATTDDPNGSNSGASFVIFGSSANGIVELSDIQAGTGGFVINGVSENDFLGISISDAGDVNGDGLADLIVSSFADDPNGLSSGASFVVFGKSDNTVAIELSAVEAGAGGFVINGVSGGDYAGRAVSGAGDVNGDGFGDLIVGAYRDDPNGNDSGASFVVFGKSSGGVVELSSIEAGTGGFAIEGTSIGSRSGISVSNAGDVDGDGLDDLIVGANQASPNGGNSGASFVVFGKTDGEVIELSAVEAGVGGFVINGISSGDVSGFSVSSAGDVNGDGFDDLIVSAHGDAPNGPNSGASFVVFGKSNGGAVELSSVEAGMGGFVINGISGGDYSGFSVSGAEDVNGDGFDDLIIGAYGDDPNDGRSGASFVVFGKNDTGFVELSDVEAGAGGFTINGVSGFDDSGRSVSGAGDVNGDGFDDLIVGARGDDPNGNYSGASFVVFGGDFSGAATEVGSTGDDTLTGSAAVDRLIGGTGNDTLIGNGGADVLRGGQGNDVLAITDLGFSDISGGNGLDMLRLDGSGLTLDLLALDNTSLDGIERIDLSGNGNTLVLDRIELQRLSDNSNTLRVLGDATDQVRLVGFGWSGVGPITDAEGTFDVFTDGQARIEIAQSVMRVGGSIAPVELSALEMNADTSGFVINGVSASDQSGRSVSGAGDVNGDGFDDLIVGALLDDPNGNSGAGASFVVFGKSDGTAVEMSAIEQNGTAAGFVINGVSASDFSGVSVSDAGDVNGDGFDDLIVGAYLDDPNGSNSGASFVVFGKTDGTAVELSAVEGGTGGFVINGAATNDRSGFSVNDAGDVNGDGFDDLIVGANGDDPNGNSNSGASFVVFGKTDGTAVELSTVEAGTGGFVINGVSANDFSGISVSGAGDVNGDGFDDLIVGAWADDPNGNSAAGASFVVFGKSDGTAVELSAIEQNGTAAGFVINGVSASDQSGFSVSGAGDVNGDGFDDLIVGVPFHNANGVYSSGASFVVFGKADGLAVELSSLESNISGFVVNGFASTDNSGLSVSSAGDVNGDGFDDLVVGAPSGDPNGLNSGASFVVFGKADGTAVELSVVEQNGTAAGFVISGVSASDQSGFSVSGAGDVNGDGFDDLIVGAFGDDPNGNSAAGASFVVFGGDFTGAATQVGTAASESFTATATNDAIFAGNGNDTIEGGGGIDRISGARGADEFDFLDLAGETKVIDFVRSEGDQLDVSAFSFANFAALQATFSPHDPGGHDTLIQLDADTTVVLIGVESADLIAGDFIL